MRRTYMNGTGARGSIASGWIASLLICCAILSGCATPGPSVDHLARGVVWQVDRDHDDPTGTWDRLGVSDLLVQWTFVDETSFLPRANDAAGNVARPDWRRIAAEPWARNVIVGMAGRFGEQDARQHVAQLAEESRQVAQATWPVHVTGWYFPVEVDPTWRGAEQLGPLLETLPKPLWISVYDNSKRGPEALAAWLDTWLPHDVGVFWQDGCGVGERDAATARHYADTLAATLGKRRVRIIAEAFRTTSVGGFRAATAEEMMPQLLAYQGYPVYLFDGPHYVSPQLVDALRTMGVPAH